jgi:hypothetical protein
VTNLAVDDVSASLDDLKPIHVSNSLIRLRYGGANSFLNARFRRTNDFEYFVNVIFHFILAVAALPEKPARRRRTGYSYCAGAIVRTLKRSLRLLQRWEPTIDILLSLILRIAIPLLQSTFQLVALTIDRNKVIVGQLSPFFFDFSSDLFPISFNSVPIHDFLPVRPAILTWAGRWLFRAVPNWIR